MNDAFKESLPFLIGFSGIAALMSLSSYGACHGMAQAVTASTMYIQKKSILTSALVAVVMISIIFFLALVVSIIILTRLKAGYTISQSIDHFVGCLVLGAVGAVCGKSMGSVSTSMFRILHKKNAFFFSFMLIISTVELAVVFAFIIALKMIYNTK